MDGWLTSLKFSCLVSSDATQIQRYTKQHGYSYSRYRYRYRDTKIQRYNTNLQSVSYLWLLLFDATTTDRNAMMKTLVIMMMIMIMMIMMMVMSKLMMMMTMVGSVDGRWDFALCCFSQFFFFIFVGIVCGASSYFFSVSLSFALWSSLLLCCFCAGATRPCLLQS